MAGNNTSKRPKTKDISEMLGEFFREAAVLLLVFYPLEAARKTDGNLSLPFILLVGSLCILMLLAGIMFEKMRG